jgi:hypothetical protein
MALNVLVKCNHDTRLQRAAALIVELLESIEILGKEGYLKPGEVLLTRRLVRLDPAVRLVRHLLAFLIVDRASQKLKCIGQAATAGYSQGHSMG